LLVHSIQNVFVDLNQVEKTAVAGHRAPEAADGAIEARFKTIEFTQHIELLRTSQCAAIGVERRLRALQAVCQPGALQGVAIAAIFLFQVALETGDVPKDAFNPAAVLRMLKWLRHVKGSGSRFNSGNKCYLVCLRYLFFTYCRLPCDSPNLSEY